MLESFFLSFYLQHTLEQSNHDASISLRSTLLSQSHIFPIPQSLYTLSKHQYHHGPLLPYILSGNLPTLIPLTFPELYILPWRFSRSIGDFWREKNVQRAFMEYIALHLCYTSKNDWYSFDLTQLKKLNEPTSLFTSHYRCVVSAVMEIYPEHDWRVWKFSRVPKKYLTCVQTHRQFLEEVKYLLGSSIPQGLYFIHPVQLRKLDKGNFLSFYEKKHFLMIMTLYPEIKWQFWMFLSIPPSLFLDLSHLREYWDWMGENRYHTRDLFYWYRIKRVECKEVKQKELRSSIERKYFLYPLQFMKYLYPTHKWQFWRFEHTRSSRAWHSPSNQREFLLWIASQFHFIIPHDLTNLSVQKLEMMGGRGLRFAYTSLPSLDQILLLTFPELYWQSRSENIALIRPLSQEWENAKQFFGHVSQILSLSSPQDWKRSTSLTQIQRLGGSFIHNTREYIHFLRLLFPKETWSEEDFSPEHTKKVDQQWLTQIAKKIFPNTGIYTDFQTKQDDEKGNIVEFDVYLDTQALAFEYQGQQHYTGRAFPDNNLVRRSDIDRGKKEVCKGRGITLIEIPFWLHVSVEELKKRIRERRLDLN